MRASQVIMSMNINLMN